jgi:hypothetical protein
VEQSIGEETRGYRNAFIGGIIGAVATALVGGVSALFMNLGSFATNTATDRIAETTFKQHKIVMHEGGSSNNFDFEAHCEDGEIPVGGICRIESGDGYLQNEGINDQGRFTCTYSRRADPNGVKARIFEACLGRQAK